jgi:O-antigen/teichoic acid export membrane protein
MFFGTAVLQLSTILNFIILARVLSLDDFGILRQLMLYNQIVFTFTFSAIPISLLYFCGYCTARNGKMQIARKHIHILILLGVCISFLTLILREKISDLYGNPLLEEYFVIFSVFPLAYLLYNSVPTFLVTLNRTEIIRWYCPLIAFVNTFIVCVSAIFFDFDVFLNTLVFTCCTSAIISLVLLFFITRKITSEDNKKTNVSVTDIISYSWFLVLASLLGILGSRVDHFFIANTLGVEVFSMYVIGAFQIPLYNIIQTSVNSVIFGKMCEYYSNRNWQGFRTLWKASLNKIEKICIPFSACITVFSYEFIYILFGEQYEDSYIIFLIFSFLAPIRCISFGFIFRVIGKTYFDVIGSAFLLVTTIAFTYIGVTYYGAVGGAIGAVVSTYLLALLMAVLTSIVTKNEIKISDVIPPSFFYKYLFWCVIFFPIKTLINNVVL